jgi:HlyD family secretion protein
MQTRRPPIPLIIIILLVLAATGYYFLVYRVQQPANGHIVASGSVEATEIKIAPELAGKVSTVNFNEGDSVKAGDVLFTQDSTLLEAQREAAKAAVDTARDSANTANSSVAAAQAQYNLALDAALEEDRVNRTIDWTTAKPADFDQPGWYYTRSEQLNGLQSQLELAQVDLQKANDELAYVEKNATSQSFLDIEKRLLDARLAYQVTQEVLTRANNAQDGQQIKDAAQTRADDAKTELDNAQRLYDAELTTDSATRVLEARAKQQVAQENYDSLQDRVRALQTGTLSPKVDQAQKALDQAEAAAKQAQSLIAQAQANLNLINVQMQKLSTTAPSDGVVITRNLEPGEVANPATTVLVIARLSDLTITVYVPEDRYGEIKLGQKATVSSDSFPGEQFNASVITIADKAEFTPRNVQTVEGRKTTVYAIKLRLEDPSGKLKYGMPADVTFQ